MVVEAQSNRVEAGLRFASDFPLGGSKIAENYDLVVEGAPAVVWPAPFKSIHFIIHEQKFVNICCRAPFYNKSAMIGRFYPLITMFYHEFVDIGTIIYHRKDLLDQK